MELTEQQYRDVIQACRALFAAKNEDYGTAWRILRLPALTDQIYIKACRIRTLQEKAKQRLPEGQAEEFVGIVNYCLMALIQHELAEDTRLELPKEEILELYDAEVEKTLALQQAKNHDYDEAWRNMRVLSLTDIILMKLLRTKQLEDLPEGPKVSEGVEANYRDMLNYSVFALIHLREKEEN